MVNGLRIYHSVDDTVEDLLSQLPKDVRLGLPLGLGKPNDLINGIYERIRTSPGRSLTIYTALSLTPPHPHSLMEEKFLRPFLDRYYGKDYPHLKYAQDIIHGSLPENIRVHEFYMQAGVYPKESTAQFDYVSLNYTHVSQYLFDEEIQIIIQLISASPDGKSYSLSSNPDMILDLQDLYKQKDKKIMLVGVVHPDLPYLGHDAIVGPDFFDVILKTPTKPHELFALPRMPVDEEDIWIGIHASQLVKDDGTLQMGIGSLSESLVKALILRQKENGTYQKILQTHYFPADLSREDSLFEKGLYGVSEMLMDGFMHLHQAGILKRQIYDHDLRRKRFLHSAFFLGSKSLYEWLRSLNPHDWSGLDMTRVSRVNDLYDENELALRRQRKNARFFNTCMKVSLLGGAASDTLETGQVVSGVGGQFNFVTMSRELPDSQSILLLRSTRTNKGEVSSNIVWSLGNLTIPRHLRDIVITEYGIANLRGKTDSEVIKRLLCITDSRFQNDLLKEAKAARKIQGDYTIPPWARNNTPEKLHQKLTPYRSHFPDFPFGSDFTDVEIRLMKALKKLKQVSRSKIEIAKLLKSSLKLRAEDYHHELDRMELIEAKTMKERIYQKLLIAALNL